MTRTHKISALLLAAGIATAGGLAYAKSGHDQANDAVADLARTGISLAQAVASAEGHAGGRATRAELEDERGALHYQVEVVTADNQVVDVSVDAKDGKVLKSEADRADRGERDDHDD